VGLPNFSEALRRWRRNFPQSEIGVEETRPQHSGRDEGGFAPDLKSNEKRSRQILEAIGKAGYKAGKDVYLGLDAASSEFYETGSTIWRAKARNFRRAELVDFYAGWCAKYPIITIEDGLAEGDREGWKALTAKLGKKIQLVGDDNFALIRRSSAPVSPMALPTRS